MATDVDAQKTGLYNPANVAITGGTVKVNDGTAAAPSYSFAGDADTGLYGFGPGYAAIAANGLSTAVFGSQGGGHFLSARGGIGFSTNPQTTAADVVLIRDAANTLAQRNGTAAQAERLYNTFIDASNGEWLETSWASNLVSLNAKFNGTGVQRNIGIVTTGGNALFGTSEAIVGIAQVMAPFAKTDTADRDYIQFRSNEAAAGFPLELRIAQKGNATPARQGVGLQTGHYGTDFEANLFLQPNGGRLLVGTFTDDTVNRLQVAGGVAGTGAIRSSGATDGVGYATGAGGTVTQLTSKATGVTLNKVTGIITMDAASLAADTSVSFVLTNSGIAATDQVIVTHESGGTLGAYGFASTAAAGSATIAVHNNTPGALAEAIVLRYAVFKSVNA